MAHYGMFFTSKQGSSKAPRVITPRAVRLFTTRSWDAHHDVHPCVYPCVFCSCILWRLTYRTAIIPHSQTHGSLHYTSIHTHWVKVFLQASQRNKHNSDWNRRLWLSFRIYFFSFLITSNITRWWVEIPAHTLAGDHSPLGGTLSL